jgi:bla regulator protein blaR1
MTWLIDTLLVTGLLIALILILRAPVARLFGPGVAYALWALPVLRLLVPPLTLQVQAAASVPQEAQALTALADSVPAIAPAAPAWDAAPVFQAVWLTGMLGYLGWRIWQYREMRKALLEGAIGVGEAGRVRLIESPATHTPVAFGVLERIVALPCGFMSQTPRQERELAIAHELEHHRGRDLAVNIAVQPLLALHWFNPLAWLGWRALRRDQEAACDARVLAGREPAIREAYGRLIAAFARNPTPPMASPLACPILQDKSIIHRLRSLTMNQPTHCQSVIGRLLVGAAALALPLTATITYAANEPASPAASPNVEVKKSKKIVIIDAPEGATIDDKSLHTRTVERNGKTIVLKTKQPLTDAEAEERIVKAEASMVEADAMTWDSAAGGEGKAKVTRHVMLVKHGDGPHGEHAKGEPSEVRTMVIHGDGKGGDKVLAHGDGFALSSCTGGTPISAVAESGKDSNKHKSHVMICSKGGDKAATLAARRSPRQRVAEDSSIPAEAKADVLGQLDAEIAKAEMGA